MFKSTKTILVAMSMLMAGFAFTACGGGESESTESTAPATEAAAPATDTTAAPTVDTTARDTAATRPITPGNSGQ
jgi:hypothetical protein